MKIIPKPMKFNEIPINGYFCWIDSQLAQKESEESYKWVYGVFIMR